MPEITISPATPNPDHAAPIHVRINAAQALGRYALCGSMDYV